MNHEKKTFYNVILHEMGQGKKAQFKIREGKEVQENPINLSGSLNPTVKIHSGNVKSTLSLSLSRR